MTNSQLIDPFGRVIEYIRLSVTDRCDLRCFYCLPKGYKDFQLPQSWLTYDEIYRVIQAFTELGVKRVRITGGEPLVRKNIDQLAIQLSQLPNLQDLSLSTNAVKLAKYAISLKQAKISRINVSLDSLQPKRFQSITNGKLDKVLDGLMAAKAAGFKPIKINMVIMAGINDDEVNDMVEFCLKHDFTLRFIETMPIGETGQKASNYYIPLDKIKHRLAQDFDLIPSIMTGGGPARYVKVANTNLDIGFITPISQHFCETCNRVRLTVDGVLQMCLGQAHSLDLKPLLRQQNLNLSELQQALSDAIKLKPERHEFIDKPQQIVQFMSATGG